MDRRRPSMGEEHPGHPHEDPDHPGKPPGDPDHPEHPGHPHEDPDHPGKPPGDPEHPDHEPDPHPEHPIVEPDQEPIPAGAAAASEAAPVEALLGLREFRGVMPRRRSAAVTVAAFAALTRWLRMAGHDPNGFYTMAQWQAYHTDAMQYTGAAVAS